MDLQAILDATDSSDEEDYENSSNVPLQPQQQQQQRYHSPPHHYRQDSAWNVEQILQADDSEEEEEDDNDVDLESYPGSSLPSFTVPASTAAHPYSSFCTTTPLQLTSPPQHHSTEDWAVLQAILNDDEDDDEGEEDEEDDEDANDLPFTRTPSWKRHTTVSQRGGSNSSSNSNNHNNNPTSHGRDRVDILLSQSTEEDEQELFEQQEQVYRKKHSVATTPTLQYPSSSSTVLPLSQSNLDEDEDNYADEKKVTTTSNTGNTNTTPIISSTGTATTVPSMSAQTTNQQEEVSLQEASRMALQQAQAYERKLLKAGHREIVSPLMVKRRLKPKVELSPRVVNNTANSSLTKDAKASKTGHTGSSKTTNTSKLSRTVSMNSTTATTGGGTTYFDFSGVVENTSPPEIKTSLAKHADKATAKVYYTGLPTSLAFTSRFIAVGTQGGIILLYDLFGSLRQRLGATAEDDNLGARKAGPVTSVDLNSAGDCCCAGYKSGLVVLWDTIRGTILRKVDDQHPSPITSVRFLSDLKVITVDSAGLVNKLNFTKNILWATYSMDVDCLLDGTAGQILAMNTLEPLALVNPNLRPVSSALVRVLRKLSLIALSSEKSSFAVAVEPSVSVLHRWARPGPEKTDPLEPHLISSDSTDLPYLPCLSWGWALVSGGGNMVMPILARAWGCCLQLLRASFPTLEEPTTTDTAGSSSNSIRQNEESAMHWPAFGVHKEVDAGAPIVALEWLSERALVYLTVTNEFTLVDTVMMTLIERIDFSGLTLVFAEFALSRSSEDTSVMCTTFQNSIRSSDKRLMVLCQTELRCISILGARRRISSLEADGEWLEALALALDHYESTVTSQEDRKRDPSRRRDLSKHPEFRSHRGDEEEWVAKLLMRYLNLAVDNAPEESPEAVQSSFGKSRITLAQSHFQMLAGVCTEFCVVTRRWDLLYGPIFRRFQESGYASVFLDVLEPYVLNDKLSYMAAEVMAHFVDHCKVTNGIATVERCLLHMDCTIMDFDSILLLLRQNNMYSALCFVFNQGLDDYVTPLEMLLEKVFDEADTGNAMLSRRRVQKSQSDFNRYGYKALLYLQTCIRGKSFPKGDPMSPEDRQITVRPELLNFLMQNDYKPSSHAKRKGGTLTVVGQRAQPFPYTRMLLQVDAALTLEIISETLDATDNSPIVENEGWRLGGKNAVLRPPSKQSVVNMTLSLIFPELAESPKHQVALVNSKSATAAFLDFAAKYVIRGAVRLDKEVTLMIMDRVAGKFRSSLDPAQKHEARRIVMELLSALPRDSYDPDKVLAIIEEAGIHRAALLLHQQVASAWRDSDPGELELRLDHFSSAINCFVEDDDLEFRKEVFDYVRKECVGVLNTNTESQGVRQKALRTRLYIALPGLVRLDALMTAHIVAELLVDDLDSVVNALDIGDGGHLQYAFLRVIISGDLVALDPVAGSVMNLTVDHHLRYLTLLAQLHPDMVYGYLSTHDSYRAKDALTLCQEHDIADASAYLLERMGNVSSALQLILQTLEGRMMSLKRTIRSMGVDVFRYQHRTGGIHQGRKGDNILTDPIHKQEREVDGIKRILVVALDLCERNSGSFTVRTEHGSQLWFNVLDRLINAKGFLRLANEQQEHAKVMGGVLSELLRMTMQRMVSSVPLTDLVRRVASDHSGSRLGELREMVESLLSTYGFELQVFGNAAELFRQDLLMMQRSQTQLQLQGSAVRTVMNKDLVKSENSSDDASPLSGREKDVVLRIGSQAEAVVAELEKVPYSRHAENSFATALTRLKGRKSSRRAMSKAGLSHLPLIEQLYHANETEPVVLEHLTGALGEAAHRGRLMTFG
jgi:hypothetical protein